MAGIIKAAAPESGHPTESAAKNVLRAFHFDDVGRSYLDRVRAEAARIVAEARDQAAKIKAKAVEEGRQAAIEAAQASLAKRLDQQLTSVLAALNQAAHSIAHSRQQWQQHWEKYTVELATAIAARVCRGELSRRPEIKLEWIREALELAAGNAEIVLRLHPDDAAALASHAETIAKQVTGAAPVKIVADDSIAAGGCRVDTQFGSLDQQLEAQLSRIEEELLG
jgi:flagellar assembly protein FliH